MTQATELRIYLFGPMRIERDTTPIQLPRRKVASLLAYLLLHPEQHARDQLATLFWGDSPDTQARQSLRMALATVRQQVSPDLLRTDRDHVQLNPTFRLWVDLHELLGLEASIDSAPSDFMQAKVALWRAELLEGFYEEWITSEREFYRTRLLKLLLHVIHALRARSDYRQAIEIAQHLLTFDSANEQAHQHLMFCYIASGDRPAALRQYEVCVRALQEDVDASPMPETTSLYQWIKQNNREEPSSASRITNLPIPLTSFIGRKRESAEVKHLLRPAHDSNHQQQSDQSRGARLLTLTGVGGSGKTRLAIQVATDLIDSFADGVWWVELGALSKGELVARAVANALGVREEIGQALSQTVANFLGDKQVLLVVDNCEHLIEPCAYLAAELLAHSPHLQILTTSREPLNIVGETLWQAPAFASPDPEQLGEGDLLLQFESLRLFAERAAMVQPGFVLTPANAQAVAAICQRLDGIPLAIELAAARAKVLTVEQIAAYLADTLGARFVLLTQGSRSAQPRHQTLWAAIEWSYLLLNESERTLFRQVAIFRGGFTLEALVWIVGNDAYSALLIPNIVPKILDLLTQLVDKSLVIAEPQDGQMRYRLLETLREYALEQSATGVELATWQGRYAAFFLRLAEKAAAGLIGPQQPAWLNQLETELANLRGALDYLIATEEGEPSLRLAAALLRFWEIRGYASEGRGWLQKAMLYLDGVSIQIAAKALNAAGVLAWRQSDFDHAGSLLEQSLLLFEQCEEEVGMAEALQNLAAVKMSQGEYATAQQALDRSLTLCRSLNDELGIARALNYLGNLAVDQDRYAAAREHYLESLRLYQPLGDPVSIATCFFNVGNAARQLADFEAARTNYEACLSISRAVGHRGLTGVSLRNLGVVAFDQKAYTQARSYSEEALRILRELGDRSNMAFALSTLGNVAYELGEHEQALSYYCQKLQLLVEVGHKWGIFYALEEIAALFVKVGEQTEWAVRLFSSAQLLRQEANLPVPPPEQEEYELSLDVLRQKLGDIAFNRLWKEGQESSLAQTVATLLRLSLA